MDSNHNILIAEIDTLEIISHNWTHTHPISSDHVEKRFTIHFDKITKDHWKSFQNTIDEKSEHRALSKHIDELTMLISFPLPSLNPPVTPHLFTFQKLIDDTWLRIINIIKNSCIDTLPHSWSKPKGPTRKFPKSINLQNHIHIVKLISLYRSRMKMGLNSNFLNDPL